MYKNKREELIMSILEEKKYITVNELSKITYTSASSIRRDLSSLEKKGLIKRNYGGASLMEEVSSVPVFYSRLKKNSAYKRSIAKKASQLLCDNMSVMLDSSSTAMYMLAYLKQHKGIKVFTNNIFTATEARKSGLETYCIGGKVSDDAVVFTGAFAETMIKEINADILFFSSQSVDSEGNISDSTEEENYIRKLMIKQAKISVFLYDTDKMNQRSLYRLCNIDEVDYFFHN